ncbi:MAG: prevent-host-death protein [Candidatus Schekmanbacteria bacterium RBG_13_48_7]|uniref:Antitoxin n=1 Tax=Candidatus Schekmanbacteria bacterium RBG_13_48_7 TaxID=1817878 RepID=A0A1F7RW23_9BACT|nr:MAG: prevent-host-death protein [Candidatus Schekmanbacteria bacterium RBG_13_48_7]
MTIHTTYSQARANLASLCSQVAENREIVLINRRNAEDVALIAASELSSLLETAHLLRSPGNAQRLLTALNRALSRSEHPQGIEDFKKEMGIVEKK